MSGDSVAPPPDVAPLPAAPHTRGNLKDSEWRYTVVDPIMDLKNEHFFKPEGSVERLYTNLWPRDCGKHLKAQAYRRSMAGVEIRKLVAPHPLAGEVGLFASQRFDMFDVVGEYIGCVLRKGAYGGEYVAYLEDGPKDNALALDAEHRGNEARFINSYVGVAEAPCLVMKTAYVNGLPVIMLIATKKIEVGEEFLLDYGEEYTKCYIEGSERRAAAKAAHLERCRTTPDVPWDLIAGPVDVKDVGDY